MTSIGCPTRMEEQAYVDAAEAHNSAWRRDPADSADLVHAKAVVVFEGDLLAPTWRLRSRRVSASGPVISTLAALGSGPEARRFELVTHRAIRPVPTTSPTTPGASARGAVSRLASVYRQRPAAAYQTQIVHALHRLDIYLSATLRVRDEDPQHDTVVDPPPSAHIRRAAPALVADASLRSVADFCARTTSAISREEAALYDASFAQAVLGTLSSMTRHARDASLSLRDVAEKIATKVSMRGWRRTPEREARVEELVTAGFHRLRRSTPREETSQLIQAFLLASHRMAELDPKGASACLRQLAGIAVTNLARLESADHSPLLELLLRLVDHTTAQRSEASAAIIDAFFCDDNLHSHLDVLPERKTKGRLLPSISALIRCPIAAFWRRGVQLLVRRPPQEFRAALADLLSGGKWIEETVVRDIFSSLDAALTTARLLAAPSAPGSKSRGASFRYQAFLEHLADANALHHLGEMCATDEGRSILGPNLQEVYNLYPCSARRLRSFFSSAVFKAGRSFSFSASSLRRAVEAALQHTGTNPVGDLEAFERQLDVIAAAHRSELPVLREMVLEAVGERAAPGLLPPTGGRAPKHRPVEDWLRDTVIPHCDRLLELILACWPLNWQAETFQPAISAADSFVMDSGGQIFVAEAREGGVWLRALRAPSIATDAVRGQCPDPSESYVSAPSLRDLCRDETGLAGHHETAAAVKALAHHYGDFLALGLDADKMTRLHNLLARMLARMRGQSSTHSLSKAARPSQDTSQFRRRSGAVGDFFRGLSALRRGDLEKEVKRRFFRNGRLTAPGRSFLRANPTADKGSPASAQRAIEAQLFEVGCSAVQSIIDQAPAGDGLAGAVEHIDARVRREIDMASFSTKLMVNAFNSHHKDVEEPRSSIHLDAESTERLRATLFEESRGALEARGISYVMPNQALAAALLRQDRLRDKNVLVKMGTGQGKSFVIAATALHEARQLSHGQYVFVLTAYDHLARRDHALGRSFFDPHGVGSACISELGDIGRLTADVKIIYADAKVLQNVALAAISRQIEGLVDAVPCSPGGVDELRFLHQLYSQRHRFILDEYDLVLNDLDFHQGFVHPFEPFIISKKFIDKNHEFSPLLASLKAPVPQRRGQRIDAADGKTTSTVAGPWVEGEDKISRFYLRPGALRISMMLRRAERTVGLSGSGGGKHFSQVRGLEDLRAEFFEVPSSRDPSSFGTRVVEGDKTQLQGLPGIWCTQRKVCDSDDAYVDSVVSDVRAVREHRDIPGFHGQKISRPVLVFVDPNHRERLEKLRRALRAIDGAAHYQEILTERELDSKGLRSIGVPGRVTVASVLCGRGADIVVSAPVPDGLHVVVATNVPSERLLAQLIGRTGRMGRDGSYSVITCGECITPQGRLDRRREENLLHDLSADLVTLLVAGACDVNRARQWLMRTSEITWGRAWEDHLRMDTRWKESSKA